MNNITTITELLLFALGLSIVINATHIAFGKEMVLNFLYEWLESKFRVEHKTMSIKELHSKVKWYLYDSFEGSIYTFFDYKLYIRKFEDNNWIYYEGKRMNENKIIYKSHLYKYRNSEGLLYIAKPIYACASCMPSVWSLPLLFKLVWWKVFFIAIFAVVISTLLRDKLFE